MTKKRGHPSELAKQELIELVEIMLRESGERELKPWWPKELPPPEPNSWPTLQLQRLLNLAATHQKRYAYTWILRLWLDKEGILVPERIFSHNVAGPGTGKRPSQKKLQFGEKAWLRQIELIVGDDFESHSESERDEKTRLVLKAKPGFKSAQIAKEMLSRKYKLGGKERDAARKYVEEAITAVKPSAEAIAERYLAQQDLESFLDLIMGAKGPFE